MRILFAISCALALCACSTAPQHAVQIIPAPCGATIPQRPIMPTENLPDNPTLDDFVRAAIAEIERREGYEIELRAALVFCKTGDEND